MLTLHEENGTRPCCMCGRWLSRYVLASDDGKTVEGICEKCVDEHDKPGRFEGLHGDDLATALILTHWANDESSFDESMWQDGWGSKFLFENMILTMTDSGFVELDTFDSKEAAQKDWDRDYADGWGASEFDIYVSNDHAPDGCPYIWDGDSGKHITIWPRRDGSCPDTRIDAAIFMHMKKTGSFPNVWDSTRYGVRLRKLHSIPEVLQ